MIRAYAEYYLDDAMKNLGEAMDYAVNRLRMDPDAFMAMFVTGGIAALFDDGTPNYVCGMSGTELAIKVVSDAGITRKFPAPTRGYDLSPEYWAGWVLAYYQWYTGRSFSDIRMYVSMKEIISMYAPLHEAGEDRFIRALDAILARAHPATKLQTLRRAIGYSQKLLSEKSGVSLRMIQQYEQRAKDINKASAICLAALSRTLGCRMEDLMEYSGTINGETAGSR